MASSPPGSPAGGIQRPMSAMIRPNRSSSRMSMSSKHGGGGGGGGGGSRASDEDGKTAVKVAVRVRPPLQHGDPGYELVPQRFRGSTVQVTTSTSLAVESAQGKKLFVFDRVFGEDVDQEGVWEYLSESVSSFIQGYNVSILAYGQSGAGKSYTMGTTGPREQADPAIMGVIPRAAAMLFEKLSPGSRTTGSALRAPSRYSTHGMALMQSFKPADKNWQMKASYVEIYNESLRDLLVPESVPAHERTQVTIREDPKGRILLTGLTQVNINSVDDLLSALNFGSSIRQTDATAVNAKSSRSHAVFSLNLVQKKSAATPTSAREKRFSVPIEAMSGGSESWITVDSKLHFVDLAGSERLKNTQAHGERAKEGISINAGLASLGKVISQLSSRSATSHISYRDSKLTRLLQDSLGGNAITYMVACVNPVEFHLSETLNTVQYAQRARAIQSKPQIQQVSDDSDRQAVIDRLRAEISFLRDQIRLSERTDRKNGAPQERAERQSEREIELQNQLLDIQENYGALSQRHAKLISEITKARDNESEDTPVLKDAIGDSAFERLKRSNSFAEAVEQVVLEYEKTIQTLEASLSNTRASLSNTESSLLEKETKVAYLESYTLQLQSRIQKSADREASSEEYLKSLEARVDSVTSGEEKSSTIIQELRKELNRTKENEASCEEYISTLEERLSEAEQDHELMQREIDRLAHVVERQRSIGKLDNLLYELDNIRQTDAKAENGSLVNGHSKKDSDPFLEKRSSSGSSRQLNSHVDSIEEEDSSRPTSAGAAEPVAIDGAEEHELNDEDQPDLSAKELAPMEPVDMPQSPAQSKFVADKLENVTQELFDLRVEHESTVQDYDKLANKYQEALRTLAALQDAVDEARHRGPSSAPSTRPTSFLADAGVNGLKEEDGQPSSSRTLSSELSLLGESGNTSNLEEDPDNITETSDADTAHIDQESMEYTQMTQNEATLAQEMEMLKRLYVEKEARVAELSQNYTELHARHQDTLDYVEELKSDLQRVQMARPSSPTAHIIRRKSSQNVMATDRANRSYASLRNLVLENFEHQPDMVQNFELNLTAIMTELHVRSERVQALETEVASVRKEMEGKMTLISGLTRERSSLKATSPLDISVVSSMRDQLLQNENQLEELKVSHAHREQELQEQIESLKTSLLAHSPTDESVHSPKAVPSSPMPGVFPETPAPDVESRELGSRVTSEEAHQKQIIDLQHEVSKWQTKHLAAMESMKASEKQLLETIGELETSMKQAEAQHSSRVAELEERSATVDGASREVAQERARYEEIITALQKEVDEHKATATTHAARLAELEQSHANILKQVEEDSHARELTEKELETHRSLVSNLENQLGEHKAAIALHQQSLNALRDSNANDIEQLNNQLLAAQTESDEKLAAQLAEHANVTTVLQEQLAKTQAQYQNDTLALQAELTKAQAELVDILGGVSAALNEDIDLTNIHSQVEALVESRKALTLQHEQASKDLEAARMELTAATATIATLEGTRRELKSINEQTLRELEKVSEREKKSSRLVQELEDQLNQNWDQHEMANNRLSALQTERNAALEEALHAKQEMESQLEEARARVAVLESQLGDAKRNSHRESLDPRDASLQRSNSANSNLRKSASHTSLPSPPPAIPLPPLPGSPPNAGNAPSPPTSRHQSKDIAQAQLVEDQEARIRTIEKHLFAEKQLTATLEDALTDLEASSTKVKIEMDALKKKCAGLEEELGVMRKERSLARHSLQAVEEERNARMRVEAERAHLEARMAALNNNNKKKKNKSTLNCF
ncbi:kinesin family protein-like protein [Lepidopterella palustris CBS 459.81]|uniref:Kinesin family protein-like protein n=1 Tax=Lepidopterella palustris CBS 459.81 TaxID=1314670 RepID=A0A8E2E808_9PEZI|nr:kinesin family protein-like protein [Lepidopterella palustris CBS 459.81]